jgi:hypothetical protein
VTTLVAYDFNVGVDCWICSRLPYTVYREPIRDLTMRVCFLQESTMYWTLSLRIPIYILSISIKIPSPIITSFSPFRTPFFPWSDSRTRVSLYLAALSAEKDGTVEPKNTPSASFPKLLFTASGLAHQLINVPPQRGGGDSLPADWAPVASKLPANAR